MSLDSKQLEATERAIRLLIGEDKALKSKLARLRAQWNLEFNRLWLARHHRRVPALTTGSRFPDISNNQPSVNLGAVRGARSIRIGEFAVTKLTEGTHFVDTPGQARLLEMHKLGFARRGAYAYLHPSESGRAQADAFLAALDARQIKFTAADVVIADLEASDGQSSAAVQACARDFAVEIHTHLPSAKWLYGGGPFLTEFHVPLAPFDAHWLAAYVANPAPFMCYGRARTIAWQYTDGHFGLQPHSCPGIGNCDLSVVLS